MDVTYVSGSNPSAGTAELVKSQGVALFFPAQLFNLAENPDELLPQHHAAKSTQTNLAGDPRHAAKLKEMEALLLAEERRLTDPYRLWNQPSDNLTSLTTAAPPAKKAKAGPAKKS